MAAAFQEKLAYRRYSTIDADYAQAYCKHELITDEDIFSENEIKGLDAVVLESGQFLDPLMLINPSIFPQYQLILDNLIKYNPGAHIYIADVALDESKELSSGLDDFVNITTGASLAGMGVAYACHRINQEYISRRNLFKVLGGFLGYMGLANSPVIASTYLSLSDGNTNEILPAFVGARQVIDMSRNVHMRDAINARKIEEFIVPKLKAELKKRPNIALVYGAAHAAIEYSLKHKNERDEVISKFKKKGFGLMLPDQLDVVVKMEFGGSWNYDVLYANLNW